MEDFFPNAVQTKWDFKISLTLVSENSIQD